MTDGGHAMMDQSMPINGVHYGESDMRDYPDEAYTCDKLFHQPQTIWKYDTTKPGFLGESLFTAGQRAVLLRRAAGRVGLSGADANRPRASRCG